VLVLVAGCRSIFGISDPGLVGDASTLIDTTDSGDATLTCTSFSTLIDTCALPAGGEFPPTATLYNSDTGSVTVGAAAQQIAHVVVMTTAGAMIDVIPVSAFMEDADTSLRITGALPVAFVATGEIEISGHLDVSAGGAGAGCDVIGTGRDGQAQGLTGDGGGGGGGAVSGAAGGASNNGNTRASGGSPQPGFAGGCAGGDGGLIDTPIADGGGVVYLISAQPILITGIVDASGAGGRGGSSMTGNHGGGGGGGGGGSLIFEAPSMMNAGQINATGGGGGGGSSIFGAGNPGKLGSAGGQGGAGTSGNGGGRGGNGMLTAIQGADGGTSDGGGGGGGATGRIHIIGTVTSTGAIAPPAF